MKPNSRALVPVNVYQHAAIHAAELVARKREQGKRLAAFPYAHAFFKVLNKGRGQILASDIRQISPNYIPEERGAASLLHYIAALDRLIESGGQYRPLPLTGDLVATLFPACGDLCRRRRERRWGRPYEQKQCRRLREEQQKRRRYQAQLAQAEIGLAFATPSTVAAWFAYWSKQNIDEDDLIEVFSVWFERLSCMPRSELPYDKGDALWRVLERSQGFEGALSAAERMSNTLREPNTLPLVGEDADMCQSRGREVKE